MEPHSKRIKIDINKEERDWYSEIGKLHEIIPDVFLSGSLSASEKETLEKVNIKRIVNATKEVPNYFEDDKTFHYLRIELCDDDEEDANLQQCIPKVVEFLQAASKRKEGTLIHCASGISRSATILLGYLMKGKQMNLKKSSLYVANDTLDM